MLLLLSWYYTSAVPGEQKRPRGYTARTDLLGEAHGAPPVALGHVGERRHQAERVVGVVAAVAQQHLLLDVAAPAHVAHVLGQLVRWKIKKINKVGITDTLTTITTISVLRFVMEMDGWILYFNYFI